MCTSVRLAFRQFRQRLGRAFRRQVRDQHMGREMRDADFRFCLCHHHLRRDPAGPEDRHFAFLDDRRIAVFGFHDVRDADGRGIAEMHRRAVGQREAAGHFDGADRIGRLEGTHRAYHSALERTGFRGRDIGLVGRHRTAELEMPERQAGRDQGLLEGIGAAEHESHEVVAPIFRDVRDGLDELAVLEDAVFRDVAAQVEIVRQRRQAGGARLRDRDQRAGLRIALAERGEVERVLLRQDRQVALNVSHRQTGGVAGELSRPNKPPHLGGRQVAHVSQSLDVVHDLTPWPVYRRVVSAHFGAESTGLLTEM